MCIAGQVLSASIRCCGNAALNRDSDICPPPPKFINTGIEDFGLGICVVAPLNEKIDAHTDLNPKDVMVVPESFGFLRTFPLRFRM